MIFRLVADLSRLVEGSELLSTSVGARGEALLVAQQANRLITVVADSTGTEITRQVVLWPDGLHSPVAQRLPDDAILVVGRGCEHRGRDDSHGPSAIVFEPNGSVRNEFLAGDGIQDVQTTADGKTWVSFFDEGVFGNWDDRFKGVGLVAFDSDGQLIWTFIPPRGFGRIADCYGVNVGNGAAVYAYYYDTFPIVRIESDFSVRGWRTGVSGAHAALGVSGSRVLLYGGYRPQSTRAVMGELDGEELANVRPLGVSIEGPDLLDALSVKGRGPMLHGFAGARWYQFDCGTLGD